MSRVPMTPTGYQRMKDELDTLKTVERPKVVKDIGEAAARGDLSENSEYDDAKERLAILNRRIGEIEKKLSQAEVIDPTKLASDKVCFGATVHLVDVETDEEISYQIVGVDEVDVKAGRISIASPIGRALVGKEEGDSVRVAVPKGTREFEIVGIEFR